MKLSSLALAMGITLATANPIVCIACINGGECASMIEENKEPKGCDASPILPKNDSAQAHLHNAN